jgi:DNA-binding protein H-NS
MPTAFTAWFGSAEGKAWKNANPDISAPPIGGKAGQTAKVAKKATKKAAKKSSKKALKKTAKKAVAEA